jgi:hypothetical protein
MNPAHCPDWGNDDSEAAAITPPKQSRETPLIRWVAIAAMIPILVWDVQQTLRESKPHNTSSEGIRSLHIGIPR